MKRRLWLTALCLIISVCMCLGFAACGGCNSCGGEEESSLPVALNSPEVTVDNDGKASWQAVEHASGYIYRVGGEDTSTEETSAQLSDGQSIRVKAVGDGENYSDSGWSGVKTFIKKYTLETPQVIIDKDGTASWTAVEHASKYAYEIDDGEAVETTNLSIQLSNGQAIKVKAIGDGNIYLDSIYSAEKAYNKLSAPQISINETGLASWGEVANAAGYKYKINDESGEHAAEGLTFQLSNGYKISVKAVGGEGWFDSEWASATYLDKTHIVELAVPEVTIEDTGVSGVAIWKAVPNASGYAYKINGGAEVSTKALSCALNANDTVTVKAVGDGENYSDSGWSEVKKYEVSGVDTPVTLSAPVVTVGEDGVARWTAVSGADWYSIEIDGSYDSITTSLYKQLEDGQVIRVKAVDENDNESAFSKPVKYTAPEPEPVIVDGVKFDFKFIDKVVTNAYSDKEANADFKTACGNSNGFGEVIASGQVFKGSGTETGLIKFSSGSTNGYITLNFNREVMQLIISCKKYGKDTAKFKVNGGTAQTLTTEESELVFDLTVPARKIKIEAEKRCLVYSITAYFRLPTTLDIPVVTIDENGIASWEAVENASGYTYSVNGGEQQEASGLSVQLSDGDSIRVTAVGDGIIHTNSVSKEKTYTAPAPAIPESEKAFELAFEELRAAIPAECTEAFTLPTSVGHGVTLTGWSVKEDSPAFDYDNDDGYTVVMRQDTDTTVILIAHLSYDDNGEIKTADKEISFIIKGKVQLKTPKINIDNNTGWATWQPVEHAGYYEYIVYKENGVQDSDILFSGDTLEVQLNKYERIEVRACNEDNKNYINSEYDSKTYNYVDESADPAGVPIVFNFANEIASDSESIVQGKAVFTRNCEDLKGYGFEVKLDHIYLGNTDSNGAHHGGGFLKAGTSNYNGTITLTFNSRVTGVKIKCQTWEKDTNDKVSVNGSAERDVSKDTWGELTFKFEHPEDSLQIETDMRIFILEITVYLEEN